MITGPPSKIYEVRDILATLTGHTHAVSVVAWSPDGTRLADSTRKGTIRIFDF
jgi:WD40 repeat protein